MAEALRILTIVGARPQFVKASALSRVFRSAYPNLVNEQILHTGQHYDHELSEVFFEELGLDEPVWNLEVGSSSHGRQTARMLEGCEQVMLESRPDLVLVYGDTNSTLAGALAAVKLGIPVVHVEAGLRSFDPSMPEEINRKMTDQLSTVLCVPTLSGIINLEAEGIPHRLNSSPSLTDQAVLMSGDVMFDNCMHFTDTSKSRIWNEIGVEKGRYFLASVHRPSNTDHAEVLEGILKALATIGDEYGIPVVLPLHPRTRAAIERLPNGQKWLTNEPGLRIIGPVSYFSMLDLEKESCLVLTDSGGVQKEAFIFRKPAVILRDTTEWTEIVEAGCARLSGPATDSILAAARILMKDPPREFPEVFGDGRAAERIAAYITSTFKPSR